MKLPVEVTGPTEEPIDAAEMKIFGRIDDDVEDALLTDFLAESRALAESRTWSRFVTQTWDAYFDDFGALRRGLPYPPTASITSVKYVDTAGDTQTVADTVYELADQLGEGLVRLQYSQTWPADVRCHPDSVIVRFVCGYGAKADVPLGIRRAIFAYAQQKFECRDEAKEPDAFEAELAPFNYHSYSPAYWSVG